MKTEQYSYSSNDRDKMSYRYTDRTNGGMVLKRTTGNEKFDLFQMDTQF